jgi:putative phage-type endonuclease
MLNQTAKIEQRSEAWFESRRGLATASRFNDVMAAKTTAARQSYIADLAWERITGKVRESYTSKDMERGTELEPMARLRYELMTKNAVEEAEFVKHELLPAGASPDGLIGDDGLLEIKIPRLHNHLYTLRSGKIPPQYKWQVVGQQLITQRSWTDFVSFTDELEGSASLAIVRFERDEDLIERLELGLATFLDEVDETVNFINNYGKDKK